MWDADTVGRLLEGTEDERIKQAYLAGALVGANAQAQVEAIGRNGRGMDMSDMRNNLEAVGVNGTTAELVYDRLRPTRDLTGRRIPGGGLNSL